MEILEKSSPELVSVIIPVYNVDKYLRCCLDSVCAQTWRNLEVILVDDGSSDDSGKICDEYAEMDQRIRVIHQKNAGVSAARNSGIDIATGTWMAFVDSDDAVSKYYIETLVNAAKDTIVSVVDFARFTDKIPSDSYESKAPKYANTYREFIALRSGGFPVGVLYDTNLVRKIGLYFDSSLGYVEDTLWNAIYFSFIEKAYFVPKQLYYYRQNPSSITSRCQDRRWVVGCWLHARNAAANWYIGKHISKKCVRDIRGYFRYCNNNIFAECIVGKISCVEYCKLLRESKSIDDYSTAKKLFGIEWLIEKMFPQLYYAMYVFLIRIRNKIKG